MMGKSLVGQRCKGSSTLPPALEEEDDVRSAKASRPGAGSLNGHEELGHGLHEVAGPQAQFFGGPGVRPGRPAQ